MREDFLKNICKLAPNTSQVRFLLAVSGGVDSMVMAHLFASCGLQFAVAHCNFHLRGKDSDEDMFFVKNCEFLSEYKIFIKEFDTYKIQNKSGKSIEMVARELRYQWFEELMPEFDFLCTAHHANDNAETLLLNLTRGTGYRGLNAIPERFDKILRPLLHFSSQQIEEYAFKNKISYRIDKSNFSSIYQRNKIRHQVIPLLETINPDFIGTMLRNIDVFNRQYQFYQRNMDSVKAQICVSTPKCSIISLHKLMLLDDAKLVLYEIIKDFGFSYSTVEDILNHVERENGKQFFSSDFLLIQHHGELRIYPRIKEKEDKESIVISSIDVLRQCGFEVQHFSIMEKPQFEKNSSILYVDVHKLQFPLFLRRWRMGDSFFPLGMKGKKKVSDLFTDLKVDRYQKQQVSILTSGEDIVWIVGYRSDKRFKIDDHTTEYYRISCL